MKSVRTGRLKIAAQPIFSEINAASAEVWNECCHLMSMYQWHKGYPHAHHDFYIGKDCEGWIDKNLSKSQPLHSQSIQDVRQRYFKSWKSYSVLKKTSGVQRPKPPHKRKNYQTTRWKKSAIKFVEGHLFGKRLQLSMGKGRPKFRYTFTKVF